VPTIQHAWVVFTLVDAVMAVLDSLMRLLRFAMFFHPSARVVVGIRRMRFALCLC